ncbi:MAG: hypothetical protein WCL14_02920 [Bacteroidota bacterium]
MEEKYLTKEEKELIAMLQWTIKFLRNFPAKHPSDIELIPKMIAHYETVEELTFSFAKMREEFLLKMKADKYYLKDIYHDIYCIACDHPASLKSTGQSRNKYKINFLNFTCPKCGATFSFGIGVTVKDTLKNMERVLNDFKDTEYPQKDLEEMRESYEELKASEERIDKANRKCLADHMKKAAFVTAFLAKLTIQKYKFLTNNKTIGES